MQKIYYKTTNITLQFSTYRLQKSSESWGTNAISLFIDFSWSVFFLIFPQQPEVATIMSNICKEFSQLQSMLDYPKAL